MLEITPAMGPDVEEMRPVVIPFNEEGAKKFARVTEQRIGGRLAIIINGKIRFGTGGWRGDPDP